MYLNFICTIWGYDFGHSINTCNRKGWRTERRGRKHESNAISERVYPVQESLRGVPEMKYPSRISCPLWQALANPKWFRAKPSQQTPAPSPSGEQCQMTTPTSFLLCSSSFICWVRWASCCSQHCAFITRLMFTASCRAGSDILSLQMGKRRLWESDSNSQ